MKNYCPLTGIQSFDGLVHVRRREKGDKKIVEVKDSCF